MPTFKLNLRFVIYREGELWFAHCLELDIVAEAASPHEALADALRLCAVQIEFVLEQGDIKSLFRAAPPEFWVMYARGKSLPKQVVDDEDWPASVEVEQIDARELELCG